MEENNINAVKENFNLLEDYGVKHQFPIWNEELSELIKEICKWERYYEKWDGDLPDEQRDKLIDEMTDVSVILDQIKFAINITDSELMEHYLEKVERQHTRKENGEE